MQNALMQGSYGGYRLDDIARTTINADIRVITSWLPVSRVYETLVKAPANVLLYLRGDTWEYGTSRADAEAGHTDTVARINQYLADRRAA